MIKNWLSPILLLLVALLLLLQLAVAAVLLIHDWTAIRFPYPLDYGEGPILDQTMRLSRLENIYRPDLAEPPYTVSNYPPLFPLLQVPFAWLWGPAFWYGRALSTLAILAAAVFLGLTVGALTGDRLASVSSALLLLAMPYLVHWSPLNRVDSLALALSWAGLYTVVRWSARRRGLVLGALLLTMAVYTRQSYALAAPLAAFVWLLHAPPGTNAKRFVLAARAFELAAWVGGASLAVFAALTLVTRGGFYLHIVTANVNPFFWDTVARYAREMWQHMPILLVGSGLFTLIGLWRRPRGWWVAAPYLVGGVATALTVGKDGSSVNYMFELAAALSLTAGMVLGLGRRLPILRMLLLLALALQVVSLVDWTLEDYVDRVLWKVERRTEIERMAEIVAQADGPVLADEFMGLIPLAGQALYYQPFEFKQLYVGGVWNQSAFVAQIADHRFPVVLLYEPPFWDSPAARWTQEMRAAIMIHYQAGERLAETVIYRPRP